MLLIPVALAGTVFGSVLAPFFLLPQPVAGGLLVSAGFLALLFRRKRYAVFLAIFLLSLVLANLRYPLAFPADNFVEQLCSSHKKLTVVADLQQVVHRVEGRSQLDVQIMALQDQGDPLAVPRSYRLRLYVGGEVDELLPGDRLSFRTRLRQPRLFGVPCEFHWPRYLASQDIAMTGWVKGREQLTVVGRRNLFPGRAIVSWREQRATQLSTAVPETQGLLLRALLLGEGRVLPDSIRETLANAGISHLFAISGLHLGLIGLLGYRILLFGYCRFPFLLSWHPPQRVLPLILLPFLLVYLLLTGDAVSTRRAFCVALFAALFWCWRYTVNPVRLLMALALLFLLVNPLLLWQPAWQLSFVGAAGILLWQPLVQKVPQRWPSIWRRPLQLLLVMRQNKAVYSGSAISACYGLWFYIPV